MAYTVYRAGGPRFPGSSHKMEFSFRFDKALQSAAWFLARAGGGCAMEYAKLIKLLYLTDRKSMQESGLPITGDRVVMMRNGPVLSRVYDFVRNSDGDSQTEEWNRHIIRSGRYNVRLEGVPRADALSRRDKEILEEVWAERGEDTWGELFDFVSGLPEKQEYTLGFIRRQRDVPPKDLLELLGFSQDEIQDIENDIAQYEKTKRLLA